jgi:hypothetical protein
MNKISESLIKEWCFNMQYTTDNKQLAKTNI